MYQYCIMNKEINSWPQNAESMGSLYSHIVFQPPDPPHYEDKDGKLCFRYDDKDTNRYEEEEYDHLKLPIVYLRNTRGNVIAGSFIPHDGAHHTILFSHVSYLST